MKKIMSVRGKDFQKMTLFDEAITFETFDDNHKPETNTVMLNTVKNVTLEDGEALESRVTMTRMLLVGLFAFGWKKKTGGTKFLTVEGSAKLGGDYFFAMEVKREHVAEAQRFVMRAKSAVASYRG